MYDFSRAVCTSRSYNDYWLSFLLRYGPINFSIESHSYGSTDQRHGDKSVGTTKRPRVARAHEIQKPLAAADFIRDRLLGVKLKTKKVLRGLECAATAAECHGSHYFAHVISTRRDRTRSEIFREKLI